MNKIHGEHTRPTNEPALCATCDHATLVRGTRFGDDVLRCHALGRVTFHVTDCSAYSDARLIPVYRLEETAWRFMPDLNRWVSPSEFLRLNGHGKPTAVSVAGDPIVANAPVTEDAVSDQTTGSPSTIRA